MTGWNRVRGWLMVAAVLVPTLLMGVLFVKGGLDKAAQFSSVIGAIAGLVSMVVAICGLTMIPPMLGVPPPAALPAPEIEPEPELEPQPATPGPAGEEAGLRLHHVDPVMPEHWAMVPPSRSRVGREHFTAPTGAAWVHCGICDRTFEYRRLPEAALRARQAVLDRRQRLLRRFALANAVQVAVLAVGIGLVAGAGYGAVVLAVAVLLWFGARRRSPVAAPVQPHLVVPQRGCPPHTVTEQPAVRSA